MPKKPNYEFIFATNIKQSTRGFNPKRPSQFTGIIKKGSDRKTVFTKFSDMRFKIFKSKK